VTVATVHVPPAPADLGFDPLRFPGWRPGQAETIQQILDWYAGPYPFLFLEAPPGTGKSLLAGAVARILAETERNPAGTIVTTATLNLQRQYANETLPGMASVAWGRSNYECLVLPPGAPASEAPCTHGYRCPHRSSDCTYYTERDGAHMADLSILNTAFYLNCVSHVEIGEHSELNIPERPGMVTLFDQAGLVIHDEAHLLERAVRNVVEAKLLYSYFDEIGQPLPRNSEYGSWDDFVNDVYPDVQHRAEVYRKQARLLAATGQLPQDPLGRRSVAALNSLKLITELLPSRPLIEHDKTGVRFRPVWGKSFAGSYLWSHAPKHLLMSATIINPAFMAETLGIKPGEYDYIQVPCPFAPMRRRLRYVPVRKVTAKTTPAEFYEIIQRMDQIITIRHEVEKGIVHSVSYDRAQQIVKHSAHRGRMITHDNQRGAKEDAIARFLAAPPGAILVSPSVGVGEDFGRDDNCRFQIFPKYPVPYLGDPVTRARAEENRESMWFEADMAFVQALGRGMRSASDYCTSYLLDSGGAFRLARLPQWVQESIITESI